MDGLKARKELVEELRPALLDPDLRAHAIDVLVALKIPTLNQVIFDLVPRDPDGIFALALNSLLSKEERATAAERYLELLADGALEPPNAIAVIDSLGRM